MKIHIMTYQLTKLNKNDNREAVVPGCSQNSCFAQFGNFTRNIGGEGLYCFRKASFKTSVINSSS